MHPAPNVGPMRKGRPHSPAPSSLSEASYPSSEGHSGRKARLAHAFHHDFDRVRKHESFTEAIKPPSFLQMPKLCRHFPGGREALHVFEATDRNGSAS